MWTWIKRLFGKLSGVTPAPASPNLPSASTTSFTVEPPKTTYDERKVFTPNKGNKVIIPEAVVLHHSRRQLPGRRRVDRQPGKSKVSYHVLIARDGRRTVFCQDTERAWHAGRATGSAALTLIAGPSGSLGRATLMTTRLGDDAMASAIEWLAPRMRKWGIPMSMVVTHQQVAPTRKTDISPGDADRFRTKLKAALN
jgi:N-acetyl-anhydromuramyl-L-alanine amidase AmpD